MSFVEAKHELIDEYLLRSHTDYINTWASVHDECDFTVPVYLRNAIMKKVANIASLKDLLDKYKLTGLSMSYDIEFDDFGSWTAGDSEDIYVYPNNREELHYHEKWLSSKDNRLKPNIKIDDIGEIVEKPLAEATKEWMAKLNALPDGKDKVLIKTGEEEFFSMNV